MVRRGHYAFSGLEISESVLFMIANKIYTPSYVSMETAFSHYHLIPEAVYGISSVASRKTNHFQTNYGEFIYRHIKPQLMFGYELNSYQGHTFKIAEMEKAILDFLNPRMDKEGDFASLRFNSTEFNAQADKKSFKIILLLSATRSWRNDLKNF